MAINRAKFHFDNSYSGMDMQFGPYLLYQLGDLSCEPGYQTYVHEQAAYEITCVLSGTGRFFVNDTAYPMETGNVLFIRKGDRHNIVSSEDDPLRFAYIGFDFAEPVRSAQLSRLRQFFEAETQVRLQHADGIREVFFRLFSEFLSDDELSGLMVESCIQIILCAVSRAFLFRPGREYVLSGSRSDEKLVYGVIHYIDTHLENMESLRELSREFGYSYTHIARKFSEFTGESLKNYHTKRRFDKANEYLRRGFSITKVAEMLGFQSIHAFSRAYKNHVGVAPREYKKRAEGEHRSSSSSES